MVSKNLHVAAVIVCIVASSCFPPAPTVSLVLLDPRGFSELKLSEDELVNVQYFLCDRILLEREVDSTYGVQAASIHKVVPREGKYVEQIEIRPQTPGIARAIGPNFEYLDIAFDPKTPTETIRFVLKSSNHYEIFISSAKEISYEGHTFINKNENPARLCVERDSLKKLRKKTKVLSGIKLKR